MYLHESTIRVRYGETDRMGFVYYGNYPLYYETARVEALRNLDISYKKLEDNGVQMPVLSLQIKYIRPAFYDDLLTVKTEIREMPTSRITFFHEIKNEQGILLNVGSVELVFVNAKTGRPIRCPKNVSEKLHEFFLNFL